MADKIRSFSQAIRLGATFKPQCFGTFVNVTANMSCVIQAAAEAIGFKNGYFAYTSGEFEKRWPKLDKMHQCPACQYGWTATQLAMHLNDGHRWTREAIADHLESLGL